jgi:S-adenosylmethionine uptake transporter
MPAPGADQPAADRRHLRERRAAIGGVVLSTACFIGMDAGIKSLAPRFDAVQLTFIRFAAGSAFALPLWLWFRSPLPTRAGWPLHALRSVVLLLALLTWFFAISTLPLVQAVAVGYSAPIFIALLAMLALHERPSRWIWAALVLGLLGTGVSLGPELQGQAAGGSGLRIAGLASALVSAMFYAGTVVLARYQALRDSLWTILLVQNLLPLALLLPLVAARWQPMRWADLGPMLLIGALATSGLLALNWAFARIEASVAAPVEYSGLIWAALLGYLLFGEVPGLYTLTSAALIVAGCLLLLRR